MNQLIDGPALPSEADTRNHVSRLLRKDLEHLDAALALGVKLVVASGEVNALPDLPARTAKIALGLYAKSIKTVRAIRLTASAGLVEDGQTLCRSLLETCVAIHYLLQKDWDVRGKEYAAYVVLKGITTANGWRNAKGLGLEEDAATLETAVRKIMATHFADVSQERQRVLRDMGYAGVNIEGTFNEVGLGLQYQLAYRSMSPHAHALDYMAHFDWDSTRGLALHLGSADATELRHLLQSARWFFAGIMEIISQAMGFGYLFDIARLGAELDDPSSEVVRAWRARVTDKEEKE